MLEMHKAVEAAANSGKKLDDIVKKDGTKLVSTSIKLPDSVKNWVGPDFPQQVTDTYNEITQHKPAGDLPH
jgi:hypothetical protein